MPRWDRHGQAQLNEPAFARFEDDGLDTAQVKPGVVIRAHLPEAEARRYAAFRTDRTVR